MNVSSYVISLRARFTVNADACNRWAGWIVALQRARGVFWKSIRGETNH